MPSFDCPDCGVHLSSPDQKTLSWGIETHICEVDEPLVDAWMEEKFRAEVRDPLQMAVVTWLAEKYGQPYWWFREGEKPMVVVRG